MKRKISILLLALCSIGVGYYIARAANWGFTGFSWIGNNLQEGVEQGDPVIGMIRMKGVNYQVAISGEGDQRPLVGSAWLGIGSQDDKFNDFTDNSDYPSLGWIHFNQSFDQAKMNALLGSNCFGAGDCYGVRWNRKPGSNNSYEGYISGWARMEIGPNGDTTPYPDIWVHFKSPADPNNYTCDEGSHNYYVCSDAAGRLEGYAWSAGGEAVSIDGNPGLGWIKFGKQYAGLEEMGVVATNKDFCAVILDTSSSDVACKNQPDFNGKFTFTAYKTEGLDENYQWLCYPSTDSDYRQHTDETPKTGPTVTCQYSKEGPHSPSLRIFSKEKQAFVPCDPLKESVEVASQPSCKVLAGKLADGKVGEYTDKLTVSPSDTIEAKVKPQCVSNNYSIDWSNFSGASKLYENGVLAGFKPAAGMVKISPKIMNDGKPINCGTANVNVKETVQWR